MVKRYRTRSGWGITTAQALFLGMCTLAVMLFPTLTGSMAHILTTAIPLFIGFTLAVALLLATLLWVSQHRQQVRLCAIQIAHVDALSGWEFEHYIGVLLKTAGYHVRFTRATGDYGVDLIAEKQGVTYAIQVKRHRNPIGQDAVRAVVAGRMPYRCQRAVVITTSYFTKHAKALAASNHCLLVDWDTLAAWVLRFQNSPKTPFDIPLEKMNPTASTPLG